eukprot:365619-Chlamydomonas_euryale.AAC.17
MCILECAPSASYACWASGCFHNATLITPPTLLVKSNRATQTHAPQQKAVHADVHVRLSPAAVRAATQA